LGPNIGGKVANSYVISTMQQQGTTLFVTGTVNGTSVSVQIPASLITGAATALAAEQIIAAAMLAQVPVAVATFTSVNLPNATFNI
jgi:hypothetical protein